MVLGRKQPVEMRGDSADVAFFERANSHHHRAFRAVMRHLPSEPRCRLCHVPYGGFGGRIMSRFGFAPSRKNPTVCEICLEQAPLGGVETEIGVLFADVRGFTHLAEEMAPNDVAQLLNRFYFHATAILTRSAIIDKFIGDQVMALYFPLLLAEGWEGVMLQDASDLLAAVGFGSSEAPWLRVGIGLDVGRAFVGNVGAGEVKDFTAIGDVVNTAARLQSSADPGQIVLSERLFARLPNREYNAESKLLSLKGKREAEHVRIIDFAQRARI
jgi:adenylate cyclase